MAQSSYKKGQVIFKAGDDGDTMFSVVKGVVGIYANYGQKGERLLASLGEEKTFGEMSLLEEAPRSATAVALEDVELRSISKDELLGYFQDHPNAVLAVMQRMSQNLRGLTKQYLEACRTLAEIEDAENAGTALSAETERMMYELSQAYLAGNGFSLCLDPYWYC